MECEDDDDDEPRVATIRSFETSSVACKIKSEPSTNDFSTDSEAANAESEMFYSSAEETSSCSVILNPPEVIFAENGGKLREAGDQPLDLSSPGEFYFN